MFPKSTPWPTHQKHHYNAFLRVKNNVPEFFGVKIAGLSCKKVSTLTHRGNPEFRLYFIIAVNILFKSLNFSLQAIVFWGFLLFYYYAHTATQVCTWYTLLVDASLVTSDIVLARVYLEAVGERRGSITRHWQIQDISVLQPVVPIHHYIWYRCCENH